MHGAVKGLRNLHRTKNIPNREQRLEYLASARVSAQPPRPPCCAFQSLPHFTYLSHVLLKVQPSDIAVSLTFMPDVT